MSAYPQATVPYRLLIRELLERAPTWAPEQRIVYRDLKELTYREFAARVHQAAHVLTGLGVKPGDRVGVLDWDSHRYLELFFAVPMIGAVLHTVNVRLTPEQVLFTIQHAEDRVLLVHHDFLPLVEGLQPHLPGLEKVVFLTDGAARPASKLPVVGDYEHLLAAAPTAYAFPEFDENTVATLFYTTGTTGAPKGVFFTHRQIVLHSIGVAFAVASYTRPFRVSGDDVYMPLTPMFHVHAWGIPYVAMVMGMKQVYPGRYEPQMLLDLFARHHVTFSHCVPTILQMILHHPSSHQLDFSRWKIITGGAALPAGVARQAMDRGIAIVGGYGMSETCPVVAISHLKPGMPDLNRDDTIGVVTRTGFPVPMVSAQVHDAEGRPLPPGRQNVGELVLRAPWLTSGYFKQPEASEELWRGGWLHTGDVAYLDHDGYIRITDRLKDVIKTGGEWISSIELEGILSRHEAVRLVAVVGLPDPRWDERPHAVVVLKEGFQGKVTARDLGAFLHQFIDSGAVHKRAVLTRIHLVESMPQTGVGKLDKRAIRSQLASAKPT